MPNLFVTGIILDYLPLVSENPSPLPFLEKKKPFWEMTIHPHPHLKPLYSKSFLQSTSTSLLIINLLHSRVAHRSFDSDWSFVLQTLVLDLRRSTVKRSTINVNSDKHFQKCFSVALEVFDPS